MRFFLFFCFLGLFGLPAATGQSIPPAPGSVVLFSFDTVDEGRWGIVNDGVMGGRSKGFGEIEDGRVRFWGELVTRGGGFTSVRSRMTVDLDGYDGLELRVRGGGRTFEVELSDGQRFGGRSVSRRAAFATTGEWTTVRVPFKDFSSSVFGQRVRTAPLDPSAIRGIGLYILDGIDGPFELEVDEIRAYRAESI